MLNKFIDQKINSYLLLFQNKLGIEVEGDMLYDDDAVMKLDTNTGLHICQCGPMTTQGIDFTISDCLKFCRNALK